MIGRLLNGSALALSTLIVLGCSHMPGAPGPAAEVTRPDAIHDFATLYKQNCSACHGAQGRNGPSLDLADPVYQSLVDDASLHMIITNGYPGTLMPAFARSAGGMLTDQQVDVLVNGMRSEWRKAGTLNGQNAPPYEASTKGDVQRGQQAYTTFCASCHGTGSQRGPKAGSITDTTYLGLVSDDALRTLIIAGRPDLGAPDWRNDVPGHPMTDQDVTDVVAWLSSQRSKTPGQPYPAVSTKGESE
ncbi:MAG TPA: c-type cytochrome [Acidisarcina sp.]|nr:c-type cytochrome [Acidisarcina sp.]